MISMRVVVPLAGPDFILKDGSLKANIKLNGEPLLSSVLNSRPWAKNMNPANYSFVLFDTPETRAFFETSFAPETSKHNCRVWDLVFPGNKSNCNES